MYGHVVQRVVRRLPTSESGLEHHPFVDPPVAVEIPCDFFESIAGIDFTHESDSPHIHAEDWYPVRDGRMHPAQDRTVAADGDDQVCVAQSIARLVASDRSFVGAPPTTPTFVFRGDLGGEVCSPRQQAVMDNTDFVETVQVTPSSRRVDGAASCSRSDQTIVRESSINCKINHGTTPKMIDPTTPTATAAISPVLGLIGSASFVSPNKINPTIRR